MDNTDKKFAIIMVGKTHSGKSTFAKQLDERLDSSVVIEADAISMFMKNNYGDLGITHDHDGKFSNPSLKYLVYTTIVEYAMKSDRHVVILANSNMHQKGRTQVLELAKDAGRTTIIVYLDYSEEILSKHVAAAKRSTDVLNSSKDFDDLIINQRTRMVPPESNEADVFLHNTEPDKVDELHQSILRTIKS